MSRKKASDRKGAISRADQGEALNPSALMVFRPQACLDPALLERTLFGRDKVADLLVDRVRDCILGSARHQQLIHGPRGSGKTHVLTVVFNRLRADPELNGRLFIARLAEEQWGIASYVDFCLQVLGALADLYPGSPAEHWKERVLALPAPARQADAPHDARRRAAVSLIQETIGTGLLLIIIENLDDFFAALEKQGQSQLRAQIQESDNWILMASTQSLFAGITSRDEPFFRFFQTHALDPLNAEQTLGFFRRLAVDPVTGNSGLRALLETAAGQGRVRAIHQLCGGNHRFLTMLYPFLAGDALTHLVEPFVRLIDRELTPYFQERLRWLPSPQQRKIVVCLARAEGPLTMKEVAAHCLITEQAASTQLRKLEELGFVCLHRKGRETFCDIREPLLRMVLDLQEQRDGAVRTIVRLLRTWYSTGQLVALESSVAIRNTPVYHRSVQMALTEMSVSTSTSSSSSSTEETPLDSLIAEGRYHEALEWLSDLPDTLAGSPRSLAARAWILAHLGRWPDAEEALAKANQAVQECTDLDEKARALILCSTTAGILGTREPALEFAQQSLMLYRELVRQQPMVYATPWLEVLRNLVRVHVKLGHVDRAAELLGNQTEIVQLSDGATGRIQETIGAFLVGLARDVLELSIRNPNACRVIANAIEQVFESNEMAKLTTDILRGGADYLESGRKESSIFELRQELRRLIIEVCGPPA